MLRGRKPIPSAIKRAAGNPGKRPIRDEIRVSASAPKCPSHLRGEAKHEWRRMASELERLGLLTQVDRGALAAYCVAYAAWCEAVRHVDKEGELLDPPVKSQENGGLFPNQKKEFSSAQKVVNPWAYRRDKQAQIMLKFMAEFGMTPSSRARVPAGEKPSDEMDGFLSDDDRDETAVVQ